MNQKMTTIGANAIQRRESPATRLLQNHAALILLIIFTLCSGYFYRDKHFLGSSNVGEMLRHLTKDGLLALGMTFVIICGGIDLSVGTTAALASVAAAMVSSHGFWPAVITPVIVGLLVGLTNGGLIAYFEIPPFIATLATMMGARGLALVLSNEQNIGLDCDLGFFGRLRVWGIPPPVFILVAVFGLGYALLTFTAFGRHVLAVGGGEDASSLMGLRVRWVKMRVYAISGALAGLSGMLLAAENFSGVPTEGLGWELTAIASVVIGGTLLTGGKGSVWATLWGALLLGGILNLLNFISIDGQTLASYWQLVIRGLFLLAVIVIQNRWSRKTETA